KALLILTVPENVATRTYSVTGSKGNGILPGRGPARLLQQRDRVPVQRDAHVPGGQPIPRQEQRGRRAQRPRPLRAQQEVPAPPSVESLDRRRRRPHQLDARGGGPGCAP